MGGGAREVAASTVGVKQQQQHKAQPPLHTTALVYLALQIVIVATLCSFYDVTLGDVTDWTVHQLEANSYTGPYIEQLGELRKSARDWISTQWNGVVPVRRRSGKSRAADATTTPRSLDVEAEVNNDEKLILTADQLALFDGSRESKPVYLAILGRVYDVDKGRKHYGPNGGYHGFAGRDATRAFVTGDFSPQGLHDSLDGLTHSELLSIADWLSFYDKDYKLVGVLVGTYYDAEGKPTDALREVLGRLDDARRWKAQQAQAQSVFPPCNSEWSQQNGGRVWCSNKSGGVNRDWVGVPRQLFQQATKTYRCACVKNFGAPLASEDGDDTNTGRGDLDHPLLKEYAGCSNTANSCKLVDDS